MAGAELYLGLDVGTQGTKGLVIDAREARVVRRASVSYGLLPPASPGAAEQHPDTWIRAVSQVASQLLSHSEAQPARVRGIGVSAQQHGLVVLDKEGCPVRPARLWCDTSTADEARELGELLGRRVPAGFTASKVLWMRRHEPDLWSRVRSVLLPHEYVNFVLTGSMRAEAGDASGTGYYDVVGRGWDRRALAHLDPRLESMLPPLIEAGQPAGALDERGARLLGLPEGVPVSAGSGDNMMAAIGSGALRPGVLVISLGTSGTAFTFSPRPLVDPEGLVACFCDATGGWLPLLCVMNMTGVTEEVRRGFAMTTPLALDELTRRAAAVAPGADGLLFLPYLQGERVPDLPLATGALLGVRPGLLDAAHVFRAALEGTVLNLAAGLERLHDLGVSLDDARLVGGGSRNALWRRVVADVLQIGVSTLAEPDAAALGAALHALWTVRRREDPAARVEDAAAPFVLPGDARVEPDASKAGLYREARARLVEATERLWPREDAPSA